MKPPIRSVGNRRLGVLIGTLAVVGLPGCTSPDPVQRPGSLASSASMQPDADRPGAWIYRAPNADLRRYTRFIVEPVEIHRGPEASFGTLTSAQLTEIGQLLTSETRRALGNGYTVTSKPGPGTARIAMRLVRVEETVSGAATVSRLLPIGAIANAIQDSSGGGGSFTGAVVLAVEVYDAQTSKLLAAAVRRYNPAVFDIEATMSTMDTARAAVRAAAQDIRAAVDRTQGRTVR